MTDDTYIDLEVKLMSGKRIIVICCECEQAWYEYPLKPISHICTRESKNLAANARNVVSA